VGTVDYCPLEQLQGQPEPRSDLYSLGATLFELLTGRAPKALNIPPLHSLRPDLPGQLAEALDRAVRPEANDRFPEAASMASALRAALPLLNTSYVLPKPQPKPKSKPGPEPVAVPMEATPALRVRRRPLYLALLLLTLLGALTASHYQQQVYEHEQRELLADSLPQGLPGHWQAQTLRGLFPAEGVGLWSSGNRPAGVQFVCTPAAAMAGLSFRLVRLKGNPRFLAYCQPWGLLVEPQQQHYRIRLFQLHSPPKFDGQLPPLRDHIPPLLHEDFRTLRLRLSLGRSQGQLSVNRGKPLTFPISGPWSSGVLSFYLSGGAGKSRCVISDIKTW
jgi:serine/threonine protein kinase